MPADMPDDAPAYLKPYRQAVDEQGPGWGAQLWRSPEAQRSRFDAIASLVDLTDRAVIDIGCGQGDLAEHLCAHHGCFGSYLGVDAIEEVVRAAEARAAELGWQGVSFAAGDMVADENLPATLTERATGGQRPGPPVFVFSGSLNTLDERAARAVLERFWERGGAAPGSALVFNFLCRSLGEPASMPNDPARRFDADAMLTWALERCPAARFRRDYLGTRDATIAMTRPA